MRLLPVLFAFALGAGIAAAQVPVGTENVQSKSQQTSTEVIPPSDPSDAGIFNTSTAADEASYMPLTPQQQRDSARRAKLLGLARNKGETVRYFDYAMQSGLPVFDTMRYPLDGFQIFDATYQHQDFRNSRGSLGMPDQLLEFNPASSSGFVFKKNPFSSWFYTKENTPFLQTKTPYSYLYFVNNFGKNLNLFNATHYQNVARGLNLGADFRVYDVYGAYYNSRSTQYNVRFGGNYITRDAKYRLMLGYIYNVAKVGENGGIRADSLFTRNIETNRLRIPVHMASGQNRWREHRVFAKHSYHFYDNQKDSIAENNRSYGYLTHDFDLSVYKFSYNDQTSAADGFYGNFFLNEGRSDDTVKMLKLSNRLFYSSSDMEYIPFGYRFKVAAGVRNEYVRFRDMVSFRDWVQWFPFAEIQVDFADRFVLDAYADFGFGGYNQYDLSGHVRFKYLFRNNRERTLSKREGVEVKVGVNRFSPDWIYAYHASNHYFWDYDWKKNIEAYAQLNFSYKGWWMRAKAGLLQNYTFMKKDGPVQAEDAFWLVNVTAGKNARIGRYVGWDNLLMLAYSSDNRYLHLPLFSMQESVYGIIPIKDIAEIHIGVEVMYNTAYYGDAYNPDMLSYYWQDEVKTGNFAFLNLYINFQVKRANIFIKGINLAQGLMGYNYIQTPHYPLQDRCVRFGVSWRFFD